MAGAVYLIGTIRRDKMYHSCNLTEISCILIDHKCTFPDIPFYKMPCLAPVIELVHEVEVIYDGLRPGLVVGDCAVVWMLGVHPDYRRRNIAQLLTDVSIRHAFASGFKYVILESTGSYSARCAQKAGMKAVVRKVKSNDVEIPLLFFNNSYHTQCHCAIYYILIIKSPIRCMPRHRGS